jgi:hypothetical protein
MHDQAGTYVTLIASSPIRWLAARKAKRRPRAGEEWLAATKHDGADVESRVINKTMVGQALRQLWSANLNLANEPSLRPAYHRLYVIDPPHHLGSGAPWSMKMGTIASPCPYDVAARHALQSANLRQPAILYYASWGGCLPDFAGWSGYPSIAALSINPRIDLMGQKQNRSPVGKRC